MIRSIRPQLSLTVLSLVILVPFWALSQVTSTSINSSKSADKKVVLEKLQEKYQLSSQKFDITEKTFEIKTLKKGERFKSQGGGGVVDGGGGNVSASSGQLLDHDLYKDLISLDSDEIRSWIEASYAKRLETLSLALPGFQDWLESALKKPWYWDEKPFDPKLCPRAQLGICQTSDSVHVNPVKFKSYTASQRAKVILEELLLFHSADKMVNIFKLVVDERVSPQSLQQSLIRSGWLPNEVQLEATRKQYVSDYDRVLRPLIEVSFPKVLDSCRYSSVFDFSKLVDKTVHQYMENVALCASWLRPEIDGDACSVDRLAEFLVQYQQSGCAK